MKKLYLRKHHRYVSKSYFSDSLVGLDRALLIECSSVFDLQISSTLQNEIWDIVILQYSITTDQMRKDNVPNKSSY